MDAKIRNVQRAIAALVSSGVSANDGGVAFLLRTLVQEAYEDAARIVDIYAASGIEGERLSGLDCTMHVEALARTIRQRAKDVAC